MKRRQFLVVGLAAVGGSLVACGDDDTFDLPPGGRALGTPDEVRQRIAEKGGAHYVSDQGAYLVDVPRRHREALATVHDPSVASGIEAGFLALYQKCPHQGCRVPHCTTSGWFECPCHGSQFSAVGERRRGPATRGMSVLPLEVADQVRIIGGPVKGLAGDIDVTRAPDPDDHCT